MLDDFNVLKQRDSGQMLEALALLPTQLGWSPKIAQPEHDHRELRNIVIAGMGGSAAAADMVRTLTADWLGLPYEVVRGYDLPSYAWQNTLVVATSHSGNTEETLSCLTQALERGCQVAVLTAGGKMLELAQERSLVHCQLPPHDKPRLTLYTQLRALLQLLAHFEVIDNGLCDDMEQAEPWLTQRMRQWHKEVPTHENYAKQLAIVAVGKTPVIYGGSRSAALAYQWKINWNETAKNVAFTGTYPEVSHNEFTGWSGHPVEKPFVVFDLMSSFDSLRVHERIQLSDRLLSGKRPKATAIYLEGDSLLQQYLWGIALAYYTSAYVAVLGGINPDALPLVERLKQELSA